MNIISETVDFKINEETVVTIGKFDGVHNGHKMIFDRMEQYRTQGLKTCVLTFDIPPANMVYGKDTEVLMTRSEKEQIIKKCGIDYLIEFPFYEKTASIGAKQFIEEYIVDRMNARAVVVGSDCTFGHRALGNADMLRDFGPIYEYQVEVLDKIKDGDIEISSTYIRNLVREGNVAKAYELSYRPFFINGKFRRGAADFSSGIMIYYLDVPEGKVLPSSGLYYSKIWYEETFYPAQTFVDCEKRELQTYIYGGIKGIAREAVSIALLEKKHDVIENETPEEKNRRARQDIFEGEKWHKEHPGA